jgi:hypothetical protein
MKKETETMKAVKIAAAIILSIILLGIQTAALTVKAIENSITAEAISDAFRNAEMYKPEAMPGAPVLITGLPFYDEYGGMTNRRGCETRQRAQRETSGGSGILSGKCR